MSEDRPRCGYCRKKITRQRNGAWYHDHNASVSCRPGEGSDRRAFPAGASAAARPRDDDFSSEGE